MNFDTSMLYETEISPHDKRDYIFESVQGETCIGLDATYDVRTCKQDSPDGTVKGHHIVVAIVAMLEINIRAKTRAVCQLSQSYVYTQRRLKPLYGINAREAFKIALKRGIADKDTYPWNGDDALAPPIDDAVYENARNHKIIMYARIASIAGLKKALMVCGACFILLPLYRGRPRFWCASTEADIPQRGLLGVHSAVVVGYNTEGFILSVWDGSWIGDRVVILPWCDWDSVIECWTAHPDIEATPLPKQNTLILPMRPSRSHMPASQSLYDDDRLSTHTHARTRTCTRTHTRDGEKEWCCAIQ
jgi:hypothetical protein